MMAILKHISGGLKGNKLLTSQDKEQLSCHHIGDVTVSVLTSCAVECEF